MQKWGSLTGYMSIKCFWGGSWCGRVQIAKIVFLQIAKLIFNQQIKKTEHSPSNGKAFSNQYHVKRFIYFLKRILKRIFININLIHK